MFLFPENFPEVSEIPSPALLFYPGRIQRNIDRMIAIARDVGRLRPHIKTHKSAEIIRMQMKSGIQKFKSATLAEAELLGKEKANNVLLAMQPVGPEIRQYLKIAKSFPETSYSVLLDNSIVIGQVNGACAENSMRLGAFLDLNVGMDRTGVQPGLEAIACYKQLHEASHLDIRGLHVYDGHIKNTDFCERERQVNQAYGQVEGFLLQLERLGFAPPTVVAGGSPTFPIHAKRKGIELSPGTTLLWDLNDHSCCPDMDFEIAAFLLSRLVSKPAYGVVCFDLGHKAVASEMPHPRVHFQGIEGIEYLGHSEEHLVAKVENWESIQVGHAYLGIPSHICPTVALYDHVHVVDGERVLDSWDVAARHRFNDLAHADI